MHHTILIVARKMRPSGILVMNIVLTVLCMHHTILIVARKMRPSGILVMNIVLTVSGLC